VESDCPRCGDSLTIFTLAGVEALTCETCGYVGVEADHSGEQTAIESWEDALQRFHEESK
jgi:Zn ribbon nucleic-acid-binding protein